jgi:hypothetical protein
MYLCLPRRIREGESEGTSELDNDVAAAHALEAAPVDDSIVYTTYDYTFTRVNEKEKRTMNLVHQEIQLDPFKYSPMFLSISQRLMMLKMVSLSYVTSHQCRPDSPT